MSSALSSRASISPMWGARVLGLLKRQLLPSESERPSPRGQGWHNQVSGPALWGSINHSLEVFHVNGLSFACKLTSDVVGLKSHDSQASYSINHGLEVVHVSFPAKT